MLHGIVVGLCHTHLDHVLLAKLIMLHDIVVGLRDTIPCDMRCAADLVECAHGLAYAKQVKKYACAFRSIDRPGSGDFGGISEAENTRPTNVCCFMVFTNNTKIDHPREGNRVVCLKLLG